MKALTIYVFENKKLGNCSNEGITSRFDELLLICENGDIDIDVDNPPENLVKIVTKNLLGKEYKHIEPYVKPKGMGWMYGGALANTTDDRFNSQYPLKVYDRQEPIEEHIYQNIK